MFNVLEESKRRRLRRWLRKWLGRRSVDVILDVGFFLRNLWDWRRILWNDRPWDYRFLLDVLIFKLEQMYYSSMAWMEVEEYLNPKRIQMLTAIRALQRVRDETWEDLMYEGHSKRWGELKVEHAPEGDFVRVLFSRELADTPSKEIQETNELVRIFHVSQYLTQRDLWIALDEMKNLCGWWD